MKDGLATINAVDNRKSRQRLQKSQSGPRLVGPSSDHGHRRQRFVLQPQAFRSLWTLSLLLLSLPFSLSLSLSLLVSILFLSLELVERTTSGRVVKKLINVSMQIDVETWEK